MRKILMTFVIWFLSVVIALILLETINTRSFPDILQLTMGSFLLLILLTKVVYPTALQFLDKKYGRKYFLKYPWITGIILNAPVFFLLAITTDTIFPPNEVILLMFMHIIAGSFYGWIHTTDM